MDHDATREQLELAALEPDGLERLMAGDTATAQAVAAHLAGCPACTDELRRLQRTAILIHRTVRDVPPADLRARTLARVRAEGVARPIRAEAPIPIPVAAPAAAEAGPTGSPPVAAPLRPPARSADRRRVGTGALALGTVAAAIVLSVVAASILVGGQIDQKLAAQARTIAALERVSAASLALAADPGARHTELHGVTDPSLDGYLSFSPSTTELVVVVSGLTPPADGLEYRCWVEIGGTRHRVGRMVFSQDASFWVGPAPAIAGVSGEGQFGISLVAASSSSVDPDPVLVGAF